MNVHAPIFYLKKEKKLKNNNKFRIVFKKERKKEMLRGVLVTWIVLHFGVISVIHVHNEHTAKDEGLHAVVLSSFRKKSQPKPREKSRQEERIHTKNNGLCSYLYKG